MIENNTASTDYIYSETDNQYIFNENDIQNMESISNDEYFSDSSEFKKLNGNRNENRINQIKISTPNINVKGNTLTFTNNNILDGANRTANFIEKNHRLPSVVGINGKIVNMNDMLYLLCKSLNSTANVNLGTYTHITSTTGTNKPGENIKKQDYLNLANSIIDCYNINGRNPKNINYKGTTISFDDSVYLYARIARYKYNTGNLLTKTNIIALYNNDYSTESNALTSNSVNHFTVTATSKSIGNGKYNLTLKASQAATIYYTRNGTTPTTNSNKYTQTLTIYNNTWVRFFAINSKNEKTPVLSYGVFRATLPHITSKTKLSSNGYENSLNISTAEPSTIYYTINGSKPTTKSTKYSNTLTIHNNTLLQFFAITTRNKKQSPTYYYKLQNLSPYVTVLNKTDVRNNRQNITIIGNKPGKIYYTINGSTPTKNDKLYTSGKILEISTKTKLKAILIDYKNKQSEIILYQPPQIITPSIGIISALWTNNNTAQMIGFSFNKITRKINYTTDNSDPKTSKSSKIINLNSNLYQDILVNKGKTLKYFTISDEGYVSPVYTYKVPLSPRAVTNVKIINLTNIYNDGTQKIGIEMDQPGVRYAWINNEKKYLGFYNEIITTENTIIEYEIFNNYSNKKEYYTYTRNEGLKYKMNYTYTMQFPYQKTKVIINSKPVLNLEVNSTNNNLKDGKYYFYNYTTKTCTITTIKKLSAPGLLIYLKNNNITLEYYNYTYGSTNQVSFIKELTGTKQIKTSVINNAVQTEIVTLYLPSLNYIDCYFVSNNFYKQDYIKDYLRATKNNGKTLESVQTYVLSNQKIDYNIINDTLKQYNKYNKSVYKSVYGTYLTGLTHMYLYNAMTTVLSYKLNITTFNMKATQMRVNIDMNGITRVDIDDGDYGLNITGQNSTNEKLYKFLSGYMGSYLECVVLRLAGDTKAQSAASLFGADFFDQRNLEFRLDNKTNTITIKTANNSDYIITIYPNGNYDFSISNNRELIKNYMKMMNMINDSSNDTNTSIEYDSGGIGSSQFGYGFENTNTDMLIDFLKEGLDNLRNVCDDYFENVQQQAPQNVNEGAWTVLNEAEDLTGSILIGTGVTFMIAFGVSNFPILAVGGGIVLCYLATGVNSPDDIFNPYYYLSAAPNIVLSATPLGTEAKIASITGEKMLMKITASFGYSLAKNNLQSVPSWITTPCENFASGSMWNALIESSGYHPNS